MWRSVKVDSILSDTTNLCWSKDNVIAQAVRNFPLFFWFTIFIVFAFQSERVGPSRLSAYRRRLWPLP